MGNAKSTNEYDKAVAVEQAENKLAQVRLECENMRIIELAKVKLEEKKVDLDYKFKSAELDLERTKTTMFVETQSKAINKFLENKFSPEDTCIAAAMTYFTLKEEQTNEETDHMHNILNAMMLRKRHATETQRAGRSPPPQYNSAGDSTGSTSEEENGTDAS